MAGQATGVFHATPSEVAITQDLDEKSEGSKEEKKEVKEAIPGSFFLYTKITGNIDFVAITAMVAPSPVLDHLTPPPDGAFHS